MEDFLQSSPLHPKSADPKPEDVSAGIENSLLDMDDFETLQTSGAEDSGPRSQVAADDFAGFSQRDFSSATAQSFGSIGDTVPKQESGPSASANIHFSDLESLDVGWSSPPPQIGHSAVRRGDGDRLLIGADDDGSGKKSDGDELAADLLLAGDLPAVSPRKVPESGAARDPEIVGGTTPSESRKKAEKSAAYEPAAQPAPVSRREGAMEADKTNKECECPFAPGAWFHPDKLHPTVAEYVYWRDPKKSGIAFGSLLVLLLSLKFFSVISVAAYITVAVLSVTTVYRIVKNVIQAIQKSNEGHPFKEYLEMDIMLSQDKVGNHLEVIIEHLNCATSQLRSLVLVEDYFDTFKFAVLAWCMTYIGAWFDGLTLIILGLVAAFTLPKVYETNKTHIDVYAAMARTKSKEIFEMVNAKIPLGKKKKDQ